MSFDIEIQVAELRKISLPFIRRQNDAIFLLRNSRT